VSSNEQLEPLLYEALHPATWHLETHYHPIGLETTLDAVSAKNATVGTIWQLGETAKISRGVERKQGAKRS
jgi:hypothetical protein